MWLRQQFLEGLVGEPVDQRVEFLGDGHHDTRLGGAGVAALAVEQVVEEVGDAVSSASRMPGSTDDPYLKAASG